MSQTSASSDQQDDAEAEEEAEKGVPTVEELLAHLGGDLVVQ